MTALVKLESTINTLEALLNKPSFLRLIQGTTRERIGKVGQFLDADTGKCYDHLRCALISSAQNRTLYPKGETHSVGPICKSLDGFIPAENVEIPKAQSCASCVHRFELHIDQHNRVNRSAHICKRSIKLAVVTQETKRLHWIEFGGASEKPAIDLLIGVHRVHQEAQREHPDDCITSVESMFDLDTVVEGHRAKARFRNVQLMPQEDAEKFGKVWFDIYQSQLDQINPSES